MLSEELVDPDDFPGSPRGSTSSKDFYESYIQSKELMSALPKKIQSKTDDLALYGVLKEITAARVGAPALFRRRVDASEALSRLWLSRVRDRAQWSIVVDGVNNFEGLDADDLRQIAALSKDVEILPRLVTILRERGILLVYEAAIEGMKLDGAVFVVDSGNPVVALSLRYSRLDIFWFTLLHELAHVALHHHRLVAPILDNLDDQDEMRNELAELQADKLARDSLISRSDWRSCSAKYTQSEGEMIDFANKVGVHPSIVAGRLMREWKRHDIFAKTVNEVDVRKVLFAHG